MESASAAPFEKVSHRAGVAKVSHLENVRHSSEKQDFLRKLQRLLQPISENPRHAYIWESGQDSSFDVVERMLLHARPLFSS